MLVEMHCFHKTTIGLYPDAARRQLDRSLRAELDIECLRKCTNQRTEIDGAKRQRLADRVVSFALQHGTPNDAIVID